MKRKGSLFNGRMGRNGRAKRKARNDPYPADNRRAMDSDLSGGPTFNFIVLRLLRPTYAVGGVVEWVANQRRTGPRRNWFDYQATVAIEDRMPVGLEASHAGMALRDPPVAPGAQPGNGTQNIPARSGAHGRVLLALELREFSTWSGRGAAPRNSGLSVVLFTRSWGCLVHT